MGKDLLCNGFQDTVGQFLVRHRSIIDIMSKLQESVARTNRAITKAVTNCGCVSINASKQTVPADLSSLQEVREHMASHLEGNMCEQCSEVLESEIGATLFYLTALCNVMGMNLQDVLANEYKRISTLGFFHLS